jgi:hypothetical protein
MRCWRPHLRVPGLTLRLSINRVHDRSYLKTCPYTGMLMDCCCTGGMAEVVEIEERDARSHDTVTWLA